MVLVADDEEGVRETCVEYLRDLGFAAVGAADGEEALQLFAQHQDEIVCVLLDLTMPRLDGLSTLRELKRLCPGVRVILCSGYNAAEAIQRFTCEGPAAFLQKPFRLHELAEAIAQARAK